MPELPEVETLASDLNRLLAGTPSRFSGTGALVSSVEVGWARSVAMPSAEALAEGLCGRRILDVSRRGKFLQLSLSGPTYLLVHLRMSGHLAVLPQCAPPDPYERVALCLADGRRLVFSDPRKFGRLYWLDNPDLVLGKLGPDPLADDLTLEAFAGLLHGRRGALKPLLLNQAILAGLGNIYTDEALHRAHLHPLRKATTLTGPEIARLYSAVRDVLRQAIANRGTTLQDERFRDAEGRPGRNRDNLQVYRRKGEPCLCCGTPVERTVVGGRGTHYCPSCQKLDGAQCTVVGGKVNA